MAGALLATALVVVRSGFVLLRDPRQCSASHLLGHSRPARLQASGVLGNCYFLLSNAAFNIVDNPSLYCYPTETLPFAIRAKELSVQIAASHAALTANQHFNPIAFDAIGQYHFIS